MSNKDIKDYASKGGKKRAERLTAEERSLSASKAANTRWRAYRERKNHQCTQFCKCVNCGGYVLRHSKFSECTSPKCSQGL